jgi:hypothetical protein
VVAIVTINRVVRHLKHDKAFGLTDLDIDLDTVVIQIVAAATKLSLNLRKLGHR